MYTPTADAATTTTITTTPTTTTTTTPTTGLVGLVGGLPGFSGVFGDFRGFRGFSGRFGAFRGSRGEGARKAAGDDINDAPFTAAAAAAAAGLPSARRATTRPRRSCRRRECAAKRSPPPAEPLAHGGAGGGSTGARGFEWRAGWKWSVVSILVSRRGRRASEATGAPKRACSVAVRAARNKPPKPSQGPATSPASHGVGRPVPCGRPLRRPFDQCPLAIPMSRRAARTSLSWAQRGCSWWSCRTHTLIALPRGRVESTIPHTCAPRGAAAESLPHRAPRKGVSRRRRRRRAGLRWRERWPAGEWASGGWPSAFCAEGGSRSDSSLSIASVISTRARRAQEPAVSGWEARADRGDLRVKAGDVTGVDR